MTSTNPINPFAIRAARHENPKMRDRDLATSLGISEAQLLAAFLGDGVTKITSDIDRIMPALNRLGDVMALTKNESCVIEKVGIYDDFHSGAHAAMITNTEIDLRMFPRHWVHGFAVEKQSDAGVRRSIQVFDAAGDAVHKVFLRDTSVIEEWAPLVEDLRSDDQSDRFEVADRAPAEPALTDTSKADKLRRAWDKITDTHQFLQLVRKFKLNRLGAYRIAGAPYVRALAPSSVAAALHTARDSGIPIMAFVGNPGCIEIHTGPIHTLKQMGPWLNVLDDGFNLHLRTDHIAEVWQATKSTKRGDAISIEAFDADGRLIVQLFGVLADPAAAAQWNELVAGLQDLTVAEPA